MGLIMTTPGWTGGYIELTHPVHGLATYVVAGDQNNAYDIAESLAAWMLHPDRDWYPDLTGVTWDVVASGGRNVFVFTTAGTTFDYFGVFDAAWNRIALALLPDLGDGDGRMRGSCSAIPGTVMWDRRDTEKGNRTRSASWRMGHGRYSHRRPICEIAMDLQQAYAFNESVALAATPRTAYLFDEQSGLWRFVTLGKHTIEPHAEDDPTMMLATIEVLGGV